MGLGLRDDIESEDNFIEPETGDRHEKEIYIGTKFPPDKVMADCHAIFIGMEDGEYRYELKVPKIFRIGNAQDSLIFEYTKKIKAFSSIPTEKELDDKFGIYSNKAIQLGRGTPQAIENILKEVRQEKEDRILKGRIVSPEIRDALGL